MNKIIKQQINDFNNTLYKKEFIITPQMFEKYKVKYWNHDNEDNTPHYIIHILNLINDEYENIQDSKIINFNGYEAFLDGAFPVEKYPFTDNELTFKNGIMYLDNPGYESGDEGLMNHGDTPDPKGTENGCGCAFMMYNCKLTFVDFDIYAPFCVNMDEGIITAINSNLNFINCKINAQFDIMEEPKAFILFRRPDDAENEEQPGSFLYMRNTHIKFEPLETMYPEEHDGHIWNPFNESNFGLLNIDCENCGVKMIDCTPIDITNFRNDEDTYMYFINTEKEYDAHIELFNTHVYINGNNEDKSLYKALNINLDNRDLMISNSTLSNTCEVRYESKNTIDKKDYEHGPVTFEEDEEVWDLCIQPVQSQWSMDFDILDNGFPFFNKMDISPNDMNHKDDEYRFEYKKFNDIPASGWVLRNNDNGGWTFGDAEVETNKDYWFCVTSDPMQSSQLKYYIIEDNNYDINELPNLENWTESCTIRNDIFRNKQFYIGYNPITENEFWKGKIYQCRIYIDGNTWFNLNTATQEELENEGCSFENGYWSGFSEENYLKILQNIPNYETINVVFKVRLEDNESDDSALFCDVDKETYIGVDDETSCASAYITTDDIENLISDEELRDTVNGYGLSPINFDYEDGNWIGVSFETICDKFRVKNTFTISHPFEFKLEHMDDVEYTDYNVYIFTNNVVNEFIGIEDFFTKSAENVITRNKIRHEEGELDVTRLNDKVYYNKYNWEFLGSYETMRNHDCDIFDLNGDTIRCDCVIENDGNFTFRNGSIELMGFETSEGDGVSRLLKFKNCGNITFENIEFSGYFTDSSKPVFEIENANIAFKNCTFIFDHNVQKTIFQLKNSNLTFMNINGNIQAAQNDDIEFGAIFFKTIGDRNSIIIDGNKGADLFNSSLRMANDLPPNDNNDYDIEQIFFDGSECPNNVVIISNFRLVTHGIVKWNNGWKSFIFQLTDGLRNDKRFFDCTFGNSSFNIIPGSDMKLYEQGHSYTTDDYIYTLDRDEIYPYKVKNNFTASGNVQNDENNGYIELDKGNPNNRVMYIMNTSYSYIRNNKEYFINPWTRDNKISTSLYHLEDVDYPYWTMNNNESYLLVNADGRWKATEYININSATPTLNIEAGLVYNCSIPLTSLTLYSLPTGMGETVIKFKVDQDFEFKPTTGMKYVGTIPDDWDEGEEYIISTLMGTFTITKINTVE